MCKVSKGMPPPHQHPYNVRHNAEFLQLFLNSVYCGTESISHFGPKIWSMVPETYKDKDSLITSKRLLKNGHLKTVHAEVIFFKIYIL